MFNVYFYFMRLSYAESTFVGGVAHLNNVDEHLSSNENAWYSQN